MCSRLLHRHLQSTGQIFINKLTRKIQALIVCSLIQAFTELIIQQLYKLYTVPLSVPHFGPTQKLLGVCPTLLPHPPNVRPCL